MLKVICSVLIFALGFVVGWQQALQYLYSIIEPAVRSFGTEPWLFGKTPCRVVAEKLYMDTIDELARLREGQATHPSST